MPSSHLSGNQASARSATLALILATGLVALPSANYQLFDGLPFDRLPEYTVLFILLPFALSPWLRAQWVDSFSCWSPGTRRLGWSAMAAGLAAKVLLLGWGGHQGFTACYRALDAPPRNGSCEKTYQDPLRRSGVSRIDGRLDFGPHDWELGFVNDNRFNYYPWVNGSIPRSRIPFSAHWRGQLGRESPTDLRVTYRGEAVVWFGEQTTRLPPSHDRDTTLRLARPEGEYRLAVAYWFDDDSRVGVDGLEGSPPPTARFQLGGIASDPTAVAPATVALPWRLLGRLSDLAVIGVVGLLTRFLFGLLKGHASLLVAGGLLAGVVFLHPVPFELGTAEGGLVVALLALGIALLWRADGARPAFLAVFWSIGAIVLAQELREAEGLGQVFLRLGGGDELTYESFAREILDTWSLSGGEAVYYYQPGFRYVRFLEHLLLGEGDVLIWAWSRTLLMTSIFWLVWRYRAPGTIGLVLSASALSLATLLVNSEAIVWLFRGGISEYPTWTAFPLLFGLFFLPDRPRWRMGAVLVGGSFLVRINQAPALLLLFAQRAWSARRTDRRGLVLATALLAPFLLAPAAHNLYYGGEAVWTTASAGIPDNLVLRPADFRDAWDDLEVRARVEAQLNRLVYGEASHARTRRDGGGLRPILRGLQALWLVALCAPLIRISNGRVRLRAPTTWTQAGQFLVLLTPAFYLAPHLFMQVNHIRHLVIPHLAMAAAAVYASTIVRGGSTS